MPVRKKIVSRRTAGLLALGLFGAVALAGPARAQDARAALAGTSAIEEIKKRGTLRVGLATFVPWAMRAKDGKLIGFEVDVATKLAEDMGVKPEFVPTAWDGIIPALLAGNFDFIIGGMTITPQRALTVNFTNPYSNTGIHIAANKKLADGWTTLDRFNRPDVTLAVRRGTSGAQAAQRVFPRATVRQFDDDAQSILEVANGRAHALIATTPRPANAVLDNPDTMFLPVAEPFVPQADAMAVRKGDPDALSYLNSWILVRTNDGWLKERHDFWFKDRSTWRDQVAQ